jgi:hypothetical protein
VALLRELLLPLPLGLPVTFSALLIMLWIS